MTGGLPSCFLATCALLFPLSRVLLENEEATSYSPTHFDLDDHSSGNQGRSPSPNLLYTCSTATYSDGQFRNVRAHFLAADPLDPARKAGRHLWASSLPRP